MLLKKTKYLITISFIILSIVVLYIVFVRSGYLSKFNEAFSNWMGNIDKEYYEKMKSIKIGMNKDEVIRLLGEPSLVSSESEITETHGKFGSGKNYGIKIKNRNVCLIYYHGNDIIGHYFIDEEGKVYFVNLGGT